MNKTWAVVAVEKSVIFSANRNTISTIPCIEVLYRGVFNNCERFLDNYKQDDYLPDLGKPLYEKFIITRLYER